jgi:tetratricopeptide (TPR) repeat protein
MKRKKTKSKSFYRKISKKYYIPAFILLLAGIFYLTPLRGAVAHKLAVQGKYYFNGGAYDLEKAVRWYKAAAFVDDKSWIAHYQLARIYFVKNDLKTALVEIDKALAVDPENKRAYYVRGLIDGYAKNYKASEDDFEKYVDYYQKEWAGYNDLAWAYYQDNEYQKAVDTALKGLEVAPDNPWLLNGLGVSYNALGDKEKGKATLEKVATLAKGMKADDWRKAYPGNNPETAQWDLAQFRVDVSANLNLASNEFSSGQGKFTAACGGSFGTMGQCSGCTCNWGYQCDMGDDPYGHIHSWGGFLCSSGCGSDAQCCPPPPCSDSSWSPDPSTVCVGTNFTQTSNCGNTRTAIGTLPDSSWSPDPSTVCVGTNFTQTGNCGTTRSATGTLSAVPGNCGTSFDGTYCSDGSITSRCNSIDGINYGTSTFSYNSTDEKWYWNCNGRCGGAISSQCYAKMGEIFDAKVGSANGKNLCNGWVADDQLCETYRAIIREPDPGPYGDYTWTCKGGLCGGSDAKGSAGGKRSCGWIETN